MSENYTTVEPDVDKHAGEYPDVHLEALGLRFDLPSLNSADLPIELVQTILIIKSRVVLSQEEQYQAMACCLAYFQQIHPTLWNRLRTSGNAMGWLAGIVRTWAEQSGLDPKAFSSSPSKADTGAH